jgi:hypothetical protein
MNVFAKIFAQIFDSTIAKDYVVRHVFMDMLVLADRDGVVDMTVDAIARRTNVPQDLVDHAIKELMNPDLKSRSKAESGARITPIDSGRDWGWQIVNYEHYRNIRDEEARRTYFRDKQRAHRAKGQTSSNDVKDSQGMSTQGEEEVDITPLPPSRGGRVSIRTLRKATPSATPEQLEKYAEAERETEEWNQRWADATPAERELMRKDRK